MSSERFVKDVSGPYRAKSGGAGGIRTHEWRFCRPLPWATWVPRRIFNYSETDCVRQGAYPRPDVKFLHKIAIFRSESVWHGVAEQGATRASCYFLAGDSTRASRKNRAASSGGVGLM